MKKARLFLNAKILTLDPKVPQASVIASSGARITYAGDDRKAARELL